MAKDDDLLPEDQPEENLLPEEAGAMKSAPPRAEPAAAPAAEEPAEEEQPRSKASRDAIAEAIGGRPTNNIWTLLIAITIVAMLAGMFVQAKELNEIYKVNFVIFGEKAGGESGASKEAKEGEVPPPDVTTTTKEGAAAETTTPPPAAADKKEDKKE
jgi:hypothetical protein